MSKKVVIIGAGFGGLASAALLAKAGFDVVVLEKNKTLGGRAMQLKSKGYIFDMGPSWYLMPEAFEKYFAEFGKKPQDFYKLKRLDPGYRVFFDKNDYVDISADFKKAKKTFDKFEKNGGQKLENYIKKAGKRYTNAIEKFMYRDYRNIRDILDLELFFEVLRVGLFDTLEQHVSTYFESEKAKKILMFNIVFLGIAPNKAPSMYSMLAYADLKKGVWYPEGGIYSVVKAFEKLCLEYKVKFRLSTDVVKINPNSVETKTKKYSADIIISNADYVFTETKLLESKYQTYKKSYWDKKTIAQSAFCIYLGLNKKLAKLKHHSLYLGSNWDINFEQTFDNPQWPDDPSYYLCVPSKTDKNVAPKSKENVFILVPIAPNLKDNEKIRSKFFLKIIAHLEDLLGEEISKHIEYQKIISLNDYKALYNSHQGSAFGLAHTLFQSALFRPYMKSSKLDNLYYAGSYTHPGIGMPTSIASGQIVAKKIIKEHGS